MERILVIANASAGTHEQEALDAALEVLREAGPVRVETTSSPDDLDEVLAHLQEQVVVAAGGDGSLHAVVNALHRQKLLDEVAVGLVPLGTGNDFARGSDIPLQPAEAARLVAEGSPSEVDLIVDDEGLVVVNNVHLGVGAQASRQAARWKPRLGRFGYVVGALSAGIKPDFIRASVQVDGRPLVPDARIAMVAIGNGPDVGGGTALVPGADPSSGRLLVVVSRTVGRATRFAYAARLRFGSHHYMKEVSRVHASRVTVTGASPEDVFWVSADGEVAGPYREKSWELLGGALSMYLPRQL